MACTRAAGRLYTSACNVSRLPARRSFSTSLARERAYGFIGLGRMGYAMAKNLREKIPASDKLIINDVNSAAIDAFMKEYSSSETTFVGKTVTEVAEQSNTVITVLPEPSHVREVYETILADPSLLTTLTDNQTRLFIDCSTIDPITSCEMAKKTVTMGAGAFVDAPMSGGVVGAQGGTLTFMLGCPEGHVKRVKEILLLMGKAVLHMGDQGAGLCGKLANNYLLACNNLATAEAMSMGIKWGLDPKALAGMINVSTGKCWPSESNNPVPGVVEKAPASRGYEGGFGIALMKKDLGLAVSSAKEFGVKLSMADTVTAAYNEAAEDERCKGKDFSSIYRWLDGPDVTAK